MHNSSYTRLAEICNDNKRAYAKRHGYRVLIYDTDTDEFNAEMQGHSGTCQRLYVHARGTEGVTDGRTPGCTNERSEMDRVGRG